jgi:hypothetical protein
VFGLSAVFMVLTVLLAPITERTPRPQALAER